MKKGAQYVEDFDAYMQTAVGKKAKAFDEKNPKVWDLFVKYAREISLTGRTRYSITMLVERIRWHSMVESKDETFKISNSFRAYYARKLMAHYDEFRGLFETAEPRQ